MKGKYPSLLPTPEYIKKSSHNPGYLNQSEDSTSESFQKYLQGMLWILPSNALKAVKEDRAAWSLVTWKKKAGPTCPFLPICGLNGLQLENIHVPTPNMLQDIELA